MTVDRDPQVGEAPASGDPAGSAPEVNALRGYLRALDDELRLLRREVHELRRQLRAIHTSGGWAVLRTLTQVREAVAPPGTRRDDLARAGMGGLRRLKRAVRGVVVAARSRRLARHLPPTFEDPAAYAVLCLPIIEWSFRFQRPQQLMRQFARRGHRVYYAANHFHGGRRPLLRPVEPNVFEMVLPGDPGANVYHQMPAPADVARMAAAVERLREEQGLADAVVVAQLPFWTDLAVRLRETHGWPVVYDCMDDHAGFHNNSDDVLAVEDRLVALADLVVASSEGLYRQAEARSRHAVLVRNACEFERFAAAGPVRRRAGRGPLIGYYGAIAEWFDGDLVAALARLRAGWRFELIGSTLGSDASVLADRPNVRLLGERPYADLPGLIAGWDAYIIPFKRVPLTEATNPVKVYEMLATGKPVVAVPIPELVPLAGAGLVTLAHDAAGFAAALDRCLADPDPARAEARRAFARRNTWTERHAELAEAVERVRSTRRRLDPPAGPPAPHALGQARHAARPDGRP